MDAQIEKILAKLNKTVEIPIDKEKLYPPPMTFQDFLKAEELVIMG